MDYLAKRDSAWMGKIYEFLGLTVGCLTSETKDEERKKYIIVMLFMELIMNSHSII